MFALQVVIIVVFLLLGWQYYKQYADQSLALWLYIAVFSICIWVVGRSFFNVRDGLRAVQDLNADYYLELLLPFGEVEGIVSELDKEIDTAPFLFEKRDGTRYFFITDNWIINFDALPDQFLYKISNINFIEGVYPTPRLYSGLYALQRPYLLLHFFPQKVVIPSYNYEEQILIFNHLRKHRVDLSIESSGIGELHFNKFIEKADKVDTGSLTS